MNARRSFGVFFIALAITGGIAATSGRRQPADLGVRHHPRRGRSALRAPSSSRVRRSAAFDRRHPRPEGPGDLRDLGRCGLSIVGNLIFAAATASPSSRSAGSFAGVAFGWRRSSSRLRASDGRDQAGRPVRAASPWESPPPSSSAASWRATESTGGSPSSVAAALGVIALPMPAQPAGRDEARRLRRRGARVRRRLTSQAWWRVQLLGIATLNIPLIVGAWLVHYLITDTGSPRRCRWPRLPPIRHLGGDEGRGRALVRLPGSGPSMLVDLGLGSRRRGLVLIGEGRSARRRPGRSSWSGSASPCPTRSTTTRPSGSCRTAHRRSRPDAGRRGVFPIRGRARLRAALAARTRGARVRLLGAFAVLTLLLNARPPVPAEAPGAPRPGPERGRCLASALRVRGTPVRPSSGGVCP